jgi:dinuclear metal center YbgI/SA1388 family protein
MLRKELEQFLADTFQYDNFQDYCQNGLQIEGKEEIHKIVCGVSLNLPLLREAIRLQADAILVHHGFFGKNFLSLRGVLREKIKLLIQYDISLFGIHLPLDAHQEYGNNAQLFAAIGGDELESYDVGFIGRNPRRYSLVQMLDIFHQQLHQADFSGITDEAEQRPVEHRLVEHPSAEQQSVLLPKQRHGFMYFANGPAIPQKVGIISGGATKYYYEAIEKGVDTFIAGSVGEPTPAMSYETGTNFVSLGHYWSEKPGIWALQHAIEHKFDVEATFVDIANMI